MPHAQACSVCGAEGKLLHCSRCKTRFYCGSDCQKVDWPTHKDDCQAENYLLRATLCPDKINNPQVRRTLSCPATSNFAQLHEALQVAFGWSNLHIWDFKVKDPNREPLPEFACEHEEMHMKVARQGDIPPPFIGPRQNFLRIVEERWLRERPFPNLRLHPETPEISATETKIAKVFEHKVYKDVPIEYEYDFMDCWEHEIVVLGRAPASEAFTCTEGEGHGAAEEIGGWGEWEMLKKDYQEQNPSDFQQKRMHWYERHTVNNDPRGLGGGRDRVWDQKGVNFRLARLAQYV